MARLPRWHWIVFSTSLAAALLSAGSVIAALLFYLHRSGIEAVSAPLPPQPAKEQAPAAPQPEARLPAEKEPEKVVFLAAPPYQKTLTREHSHGKLRPEILRQAFLLTAREEFGLSTRDAALREPNPKQLSAANQFRIDTAIQPGGTAQVLVEQGDAAARKQILKSETPQVVREGIGYRALTKAAETLSRREFVNALKQAGFTPRPHDFQPKASLPAEIDKGLVELTLLSQVAALRQLHAAARSGKESPEVVGGLVRAYANLGVLTEHLWLAGHRVFKARALLYAERLCQRLPNDPWGLWHRAYAEALTGLHGEALDDLKTATDRAAGAEPPEWVAVLEPFCRFDADRLAELAAKPKLSRLAHLLHFLSVEDRDTLNLSLDSAQTLLKENPECTRVFDALCDIGGVNVKHQITVAYLAILSSAVPARLVAMPGLPETVTRQLRREASESDAWQALLEAGDRDTEEPSWGVVSRTLQEERFASIWRRVDFMRYSWGVPVEEFVEQVVPLLANHPYRGLIRSYALEPHQDPAAYKKLVAELPIDDVDFRFTTLLRVLRQTDPRKGPDAYQRARGQTDEDYQDLAALLRYERTPYNARRLLKVSPHAGIAIAAVLDLDPKLAEETVAAWEKDEGHQPAVLRSLAHRYTQRKSNADAERCWKAYLERSPDFAGYRGLANLYKGQDKLDDWKATLDEYLQQGEQDLQHARIRVDIAEGLMARKKWKEAQPYAEEAAQTWAAWAMLCANQCYEGLGKWDEAELWVRRTAERYPNNTFGWFFWCWRTGKGDEPAARKMVEDYLRKQGGRLSEEDQSHTAVFHTLIGQEAKAFPLIEALYQQKRLEPACMWYGMACDAAGKTKERDRVWNAFPGNDTVYGRVVRLFRECLAKGEKSAVDTEAVDKVLTTASPALKADASYFVGHFLLCRGQTETANRYLDRSATSSKGNSYIRLLAIARLRQQKIEPGTLDKDSKKED